MNYYYSPLYRAAFIVEEEVLDTIGPVKVSLFQSMRGANNSRLPRCVEVYEPHLQSLRCPRV